MKELTEKQVSKYRNDVIMHKLVDAIVNTIIEFGYKTKDLEDVFELSRHKYKQLSDDIFKHTNNTNRHLWE